MGTVATKLLPIHTPALFAEAVERAAAHLRQGEVVALPTETVYGLAANALDPAAVARIFAVKGRPSGNPLIVHVVGWEMVGDCAREVTPEMRQLGRAFWPGPLTMVQHRQARIPDVVTAGGGTVGVRWPSHPFIQAVIKACGFPLAAPSANLSNQLSPTTAQHVRKGLWGKIPLIVDGGECNVGVESTVLDLTTKPARLLRPGMVTSTSLEAVLGTVVTGARASQEEGAAEPLRSPGLLSKHYAPKARLIVAHWDAEGDLAGRLPALGVDPSRVRVLAHTVIPSGLPLEHVSLIPHDPEAFARALYAELHRCDDLGAEVIVVEAVPEEPDWQAVRDRLARASSG